MFIPFFDEMHFDEHELSLVHKKEDALDFYLSSQTDEYVMPRIAQQEESNDEGEGEEESESMSEDGSQEEQQEQEEQLDGIPEDVREVELQEQNTSD